MKALSSVAQVTFCLLILLQSPLASAIPKPAHRLAPRQSANPTSTCPNVVCSILSDALKSLSTSITTSTTSSIPSSSTSGNCPATTPTPPIPGCYGQPGCAYVIASDLGPGAACKADYCNCGGTNAPLLTTTISGKATTNCAYTTQPRSNNCPTITAAPASSSSASASKPTGDGSTLPIVNPPIVLPSFTGCTSKDTRTMSFTTVFPHATGYETIGGGSGNMEWWNQSGAVWVLSVETMGFIIQDLGLYDTGTPFPSAYSSALVEGPKSSAFTISVPAANCLATEPPVTFSVEPATKDAALPTTYTLSVSGEYACASNTVLNPPNAECTRNPDWDLTQANWKDANVDQLLYNWWFDYKTDECDKTQLGTNGLTNLSPPNTANDVASELAYWAANIRGFDCSMAAASNSCSFVEDPCKYPGIPRWAYFALAAMSNLHNNLANIDTSVFKGAVSNGFIASSVLDGFKKQPKPDGYLGQLILTIIGPIITVIGIFLPVLFPAFAAVEASAIAAEQEINQLAQTAAARIKEAFVKPFKNIDKSAPAYGIIPGTIASGAAGVWGKITSASTSASQALNEYNVMLDQNWQQSQSVLNSYNDNLFTRQDGENDWAGMLMLILWGGTYVAKPTYHMQDLIDAFRTDVTSKMINQMFAVNQVYVQFTDLGDDNSQAKCKADDHGPVAARYCADGGVYYVKAMTIDGSIPMSAMPYGYSHLEETGITPWWISAASSKVYRQYHLSFDPTDANAFTETIGNLISENPDNIKGLIGQLPGEWSLPVCDGGKNYYGCDDVSGKWCGNAETYKTSSASSRTGSQTINHQWVPCACGFQGNETVQFFNNTGIAAKLNMDVISLSCTRFMSENNNQGYLAINGGMPANNEITLDSSHTITMSPTAAKPTTDPTHYV